MRTIFLALSLLAPGIALAQIPAPETRPPLTVEEAVRLAVHQNPRLTAVALEIRAAQSGVRSARALTNPSVVFTPALTPGGADEELLIQQPLELNGTRSARTGVAQAQLRQTRSEAVNELREVVLQTQNAYYELARASELRAVSRDALRLAEEIDQATRRQAEEGLRPGIDRVSTGIEVTRARQQLTQAEARVTTAIAALNTLMGRPPTEPVPSVSPLPAPEAPVEAAALVEQALAARTEIQVQQALQEQFRQEGRLARAQGRPDLAPQLRAGNLTRGVSDTGIGLGITMPFLDYGSRRNRVRQAEESTRAQEARIAATRNQVRQEVEQAVARLNAAAAVVRDYQGGVIDQARRLLEGTRTGYQSGIYTIVQLLEAQRTYRNVQADYQNALADYAQARAALERAAGTVSPDLLPADERTPRNPQ